jgi:hypothetical protein
MMAVRLNAFNANDENSHNRILIEDIKILINVNNQLSLKDKEIKVSFVFH